MAIPAPPFDRDYKNYDFDVIKEDWNEYDLKDGAKVRAKFTLLKLIKSKTTPTDQYDIVSTQLMTVTTDSNTRQPPTPQWTPEELKAMQAGNFTGMFPVEVLTNIENWNEYRVRKTDEHVRIKLVLVDVYRIPDRYDELGEPSYYISTGRVVAPMLKRERLTP